MFKILVDEFQLIADLVNNVTKVLESNCVGTLKVHVVMELTQCPIRFLKIINAKCVI